MKIYYEKVGKRYRPVRISDEETFNTVPYGITLLKYNHKDGTKSVTTCSEEELIPIYAAMLSLKNDFLNMLVEANEPVIRSDELTPEEVEAWTNFVKVFKKNSINLPSLSEVATKFLKLLTEKVNDLMTNETVKSEYEKFVFLLKLSQENSSKSKN